MITINKEYYDFLMKAGKFYDDLKCCGNCWWLYDDCKGINDGTGCCDRWNYDKHTHDERKEY